MSALSLAFVREQLEQTLADFDTAPTLTRTRLEVLVSVVKGATSVLLAPPTQAPDPALASVPAPCRDAGGSPSTQPAEPDAAAESTEDPRPPAEEGAQPAAPETTKPKGSGGRLGKPNKWTAERKAELLRLWFTVPAVRNRALAEALNALPGERISITQVSVYGSAALKLPTRESAAWLAEVARRSQEARQAAAAPNATSASAPAPKAPATAAAPAVRTPPAAPENPQEIEAKQLMREGWSARDVHTDFGGTIPMSTLSLWALQVRQEKEQKA